MSPPTKIGERNTAQAPISACCWVWQGVCQDWEAQESSTWFNCESTPFLGAIGKLPRSGMESESLVAKEANSARKGKMSLA
jgi:hypothetical protein